MGHRNSESLSTNEPGTPVKIPGTREIELPECPDPCNGKVFRLCLLVEVFEWLEVSPELPFPAEVEGWAIELVLYDNCESFGGAFMECEDLAGPPL